MEKTIISKPTILDLVYEGSYVGKSSIFEYWRLNNKFYKYNMHDRLVEECSEFDINKIFIEEY